MESGCVAENMVVSTKTPSERKHQACCNQEQHKPSLDMRCLLQARELILGICYMDLEDDDTFVHRISHADQNTESLYSGIVEAGIFCLGNLGFCQTTNSASIES